MKKTTHNSGVLSMYLCAVAFLLLSAGSLSAQSHRVTGKVVDENNEPLAGVAVFVEGAYLLLKQQKLPISLPLPVTILIFSISSFFTQPHI